MVSKKEINNISIEYKEKLLEINKTFYMLFQAKGYSPDSHFNSDVWFLKNDECLNNLRTTSDINDKKTLNKDSKSLPKDNKVLKIISFLTSKENEEMTLPNKIKVMTSDFVELISKQLIETKILIDNYEEQMKKYKIEELLSVIDLRIKSLEAKKLKMNLYDSTLSKIVFYISKLEYFPEGEYTFILTTNELESSGITKFQEKKLTSKKKIKLIIGGQIVNLLQLNLQFKDISYAAIELKTGIEKKESDKKSEKEINKKESSTKVESYDDSSDNFSFNKSKNKNRNSNKHNIENTGSSLINFGIKVERNGEEFGLSIENFLDILLLNIEELLDNSKNSIISSFKSTIMVKEETQIKHNLGIGEYDVTIGMRLDMNVDFKISVLQRIYNIFMANITLKAYHEKIIFTIIEYFPEVMDKLKNILNPNSESRDGACCGKCTIF